MSHALLDDVRDSLKRARLGPEATLVVGFSGGVDSQTLTHSLAILRDRGEGPLIQAVHVDHQLRPESARDARECQQAAAVLDVPLEIVRVDVFEWDRGDGVEAAARMARYAALAGAAQNVGAGWIALGHTLDDQAETILLRLARGTSLDGITGMRVIARRTVPIDPSGKSNESVQLLRPLLSRRRNEIEAYARECGLVPVEDASNVDVRYRRNAIRHQLVPLLEKIVPGAVESIGRSSTLMADDADYLAFQATTAFAESCEWLGPCIQIHRSAIRKLPVSLQRRVIVMAVYALSNQTDLSSERVEALRSAAVGGAVSRMIQVGSCLGALVCYDWLVLGPSDEIVPTLRANSGLPLLARDTIIPINQSVGLRLGDRWRLDVQVKSPNDGWQLRTRRPGDRLVMSGTPTRRLQDWFVNQKVPAYLRDHVPLLTYHGNVRWIAGFFSPVYEDVDSGLVARLTEQPGEDNLNDEHVAGYSPA